MCYSLWYNAHTMLPARGWPATSSVHYTTSCNTQSSVLEDGQNNCPKYVELAGILLSTYSWLSILFIFHYIFLRLAKQSHLIPLQNVVYFMTLAFFVLEIFTFYINDVLLLKCPVPGPRG